MGHHEVLQSGVRRQLEIYKRESPGGGGERQKERREGPRRSEGVHYWIQAKTADEDRVDIGRLLLVDRSTILVSSMDPDTLEEHAVFGEGFENGIVVIARRIMSEGLSARTDSD